MIAYLIVFLVAGVVTMIATPLVIRLAARIGAIDRPTDPRKIHREPVPTIGGLAMLVGFIVAIAVAWRLDDFSELFTTTSEPLGLVLGVIVIAIVGFVDDTRGLQPTVKLAGQMLAALIPIVLGIQIVFAWIPGLGVIALSSDLGLVVTLVAMVAMINAVNLIDGLDGLAAGVVAIAAVSFFVFSIASENSGIADSVPTAAPMVAAALTGMCLGFLVFNFHPAKIFMGDTGAMMLGLLLASSGVAYVGRTTAPNSADFAGSVPLLIPVLVLAIPFLDTAFAVARRAYRKQGLMTADKGHLHHLLISFGHSHRRAVLTMYYWSAFLAFAFTGLSLVRPLSLLIAILVAAFTIGAVITAVGIRAPVVDGAASAVSTRRASGDDHGASRR